MASNYSVHCISCSVLLAGSSCSIPKCPKHICTSCYNKGLRVSAHDNNNDAPQASARQSTSETQSGAKEAVEAARSFATGYTIGKALGDLASALFS